MKLTVFKTSIVLLLTGIYLFIVFNNYRLNNFIHEGDQRPYINSAIKIRTENIWYMGDRNRMPIYPYIMAVFYKPDMSIEEFFQTGKFVNIVISLICLLILYKFVSGRLPDTAKWIFIIITALTLFSLKAAYFQVEILFYTLFFITFIKFVENIKKPSIKKGVVIGILCALTYLTKATILLGFAVYILFLMSETLVNFVKGSKVKSKKLLITISAIVITFLTLVSPYLIQNKMIFGRYLYNVNTTFYVWYDNIQQAIDGTSAKGDAVGWPDMPENEIPSFKNYIQTHTGLEIRDRFIVGFLRIILFSIWTYAVIPFSFLLLFFIFLFYYAFLHRKDFLRLVRENKKGLIFIFLFYFTQIIAFSWYAYIDSGPRFTLTLFIPTLYLLNLALVKLDQKYTALKYFYWVILMILLVSLIVSIFPISKAIYSGF